MPLCDMVQALIMWKAVLLAMALHWGSDLGSVSDSSFYSDLGQIATLSGNIVPLCTIGHRNLCALATVA